MTVDRSYIFIRDDHFRTRIKCLTQVNHFHYRYYKKISILFDWAYRNIATKLWYQNFQCHYENEKLELAFRIFYAYIGANNNLNVIFDENDVKNDIDESLCTMTACISLANKVCATQIELPLHMRDLAMIFFDGNDKFAKNVCEKELSIFVKLFDLRFPTICFFIYDIFGDDTFSQQYFTIDKNHLLAESIRIALRVTSLLVDLLSVQLVVLSPAVILFTAERLGFTSQQLSSIVWPAWVGHHDFNATFQRIRQLYMQTEQCNDDVNFMPISMFNFNNPEMFGVNNMETVVRQFEEGEIENSMEKCGCDTLVSDSCKHDNAQFITPKQQRKQKRLHT